MTEAVSIFEVGPRDGLQNEPTPILVSDKIRLIDLLSDTGLKKIESASFVSPKWVPQMANSDQVLSGIARHPDITYSALTPNIRGFHEARKSQADEVAIFASASESFSQYNINCSIAESLERFEPILHAAKKAGITVRGYVSCVVDCPYDGKTDPDQVAKVAHALRDLGCYEISLGDTLGQATPEDISILLDCVLTDIPNVQIAGHFHDTSGRALDCIAVALDKGIRQFDSSIAGLGGCPYAPGAAGNIATEKLVSFLHANGFVTSINLAALATAAEFAANLRTST